MSLCQYKDSLGIPGEGIHTHVLGIAIIDLILTICFAYLLSNIYSISLFITLISLLLLGIILHKLFCVDTTINKIIFGKQI